MARGLPSNIASFMCRFLHLLKVGDRQFDLLPLAARTPAPQSGEYVNTGSDITGLWQTRSLTHCFVEALAPVDAQSQPDLMI